MNSKIDPDTRRRLAMLIGVDDQYLYQCLSGRRDMGPALAMRAELLTKTQPTPLTRQMLCQHTYAAIWPDLASTPAPSPRP